MSSETNLNFTESSAGLEAAHEDGVKESESCPATSWDEQLIECDKLIEHSPQDIQLYIKKAYILTNMGHVDKAIDEYIKAVVIDPDNPELCYSIATFLTILGLEDAAHQLFLKASVLKELNESEDSKEEEFNSAHSNSPIPRDTDISSLDGSEQYQDCITEQDNTDAMLRSSLTPNKLGERYSPEDAYGFQDEITSVKDDCVNEIGVVNED